MRENLENERNLRNDSESRDRGSRGRGRGMYKFNIFSKHLAYRSC